MSVFDGQLNIDFSGVIRLALISAISVVKASIVPPPDEPEIAVNTSAIDFGRVLLGNSVSSLITVTNDGLQTLTVSDLVIFNNPDFTITSPAVPFDIAPGGSQQVVVDYTPSVTGAVSGSLDIISNDPDEATLTVSLAGNGVDQLELRINVGDTGFTDVNGDFFVADKAYVAGDYGYIGGAVGVFTSDVSGTSDDFLYQSMRGGSTFSYNFDNLPDGDYTVTLYFTEPIFAVTGERLFDVSAEGVPVLSSFDIVAASGGGFVAHSESFTMSVFDGQLNIDFSGVIRLALISAISVVLQ